MQSIDKHTLIILFIFGVSFCLLLYSTQQINLTYDSGQYLDAAKNLRDTGKLLDGKGESFIWTLYLIARTIKNTIVWKNYSLVEATSFRY
ncbi:MAG: hypothetical protein ACFHWX_21770 [Bacteroidota bacterium]